MGNKDDLFYSKEIRCPHCGEKITLTKITNQSMNAIIKIGENSHGGKKYG